MFETGECNVMHPFQLRIATQYGYTLIYTSYNLIFCSSGINFQYYYIALLQYLCSNVQLRIASDLIQPQHPL